ncbi:hypothetical protein [Streptomyces europaeiscabiei]|uniref:Uncharacterized protein n=1 Tax=Streptomyces europaeiscabiei TaxID=146819 RepID=A0ABU4NUZ6_9ACTN|nr:hypothetical protein [Streptomyces europaeiscabiei]MDX2772365.1 hypothetical protein [Streptomyces europaeiscabiei]MDX3548544.1 hypothetical protein [Streptomyces europaeiscabiei]MDX3558188.1 hypothetical protein [Streptomyces europaeiscabiei]MDX3706017.1 hypothetical protein [Streptomyces europaeiscabiei]MDX3710245.1 hypothetical protein [Streptomyces europaeiscabiei]
MDQDMVVLARVRLLSANRRVVRGAEGLWIYRLLTRVEPETYGSKLAYVLVEASASPLVRELSERRLALLDEAVQVAKALGTSNPYRAKMLARALAARERELEGRPVEPLASEGREHRAALQEESQPRA